MCHMPMACCNTACRKCRAHCGPWVTAHHIAHHSTVRIRAAHAAIIVALLASDLTALAGLLAVCVVSSPSHLDHAPGLQPCHVCLNPQCCLRSPAAPDAYQAMTPASNLTPEHAAHLQELVLKRAAFQRKQRALADALAIGARLARHRKRTLQAATFQAWRMRCHLFKRVAQCLRGALSQRAADTFDRWRQYVAAQVWPAGRVSRWWWLGVVWSVDDGFGSDVLKQL